MHAVQFQTEVQKHKQTNAYMIQWEEVPCIGLNVNPVRDIKNDSIIHGCLRQKGKGHHCTIIPKNVSSSLDKSRAVS